MRELRELLRGVTRANLVVGIDAGPLLRAAVEAVYTSATLASIRHMQTSPVSSLDDAFTTQWLRTEVR